MAAVESLLKVMMLRDADAMILEPNRVPSLRRRGQIEALAMPALEPAMLADFAAPLVAGRSPDELPAMVQFTDGDGASFAITVEQVAAGYRLNVRRGKPAPARPPAKLAAVGAPEPAAQRASAPAATGRSSAPPVGPAIGSSAASSVAPSPAPAAVPALPPAPSTTTAVAARHVATARLAELLAEPVALARSRGASDVTLSTAQTPRLRIDGRLELLDHAIDDAELAACVTGLAADTGFAGAGTAGFAGRVGISVDLSLDIDGVRVRINAFDHLGGHAIAVRLIRDHVPGLAELGLPTELGAAIEARDGLVLVCGPTGSGKSTTLAALLDLLDQRRAAHVITLEDPIEYRFPARRCLIHQRELGSHVPSFADGLRAALREAPDVILLGELRDRDTIAAALTAAETGHLVLATLHAPSAAGAIDRIIDAFPDAQRQVRWQLAGVLRTIVTQYLLPRKAGGRVAAIELVPVTPAVANILRRGDLHTLPTAIQSGRDAGMIPLERSLSQLVDAGVVSAQAVKRIAADHDLLAALAGKRAP